MKKENLPKYSFKSFLFAIFILLILLVFLLGTLTNDIYMGYKGYDYHVTFGKDPVVFTIIGIFSFLGILYLLKMIKDYFVHIINVIKERVQSQKEFDWENID